MQQRSLDPGEFEPYLTPTEIIDSDNHTVRKFAEEAAGAAADAAEQAAALYLAVRDGIRYDPYAPFHLPMHYSASYVLKRGRSFCIPKASLLCAASRAVGIPSRIGFANVRNHLATRQLLEFLGTDIFPYHAFAELYVDGKWVKATPAFNRELCERHKVRPLEFNAHDDSLFQPYNEENQRYMEYIEFLGTYQDVPVQKILSAWKQAYGEERVESWIKTAETDGSAKASRFEAEEVWNA